MSHKPFKTIGEQIELFKIRGLSIQDEESAAEVLLNTNYYRLSGYTLTLRKDNKFAKGTTFDDVMQIYYFDKDLRALLLKYLEDTEIELRSHIAYELGKMDTDPDEKVSYMKPTTFVTETHFNQFLEDLQSAHKNSSNEAFVKHHDTKYGGVMPVWAMIETLSFGSLSRMFSGLDITLKKQIAQTYYPGLNGKVLDNWFEGLVVLRNACAHRARLFNRGFIMSPNFAKNDDAYFRSQGYDGSQIGKRLFFRLIVLIKISSNPVKTRESLISDIESLCQKYPFVDLKNYGFMKNWKDMFNYLIQ